MPAILSFSSRTSEAPRRVLNECEYQARRACHADDFDMKALLEYATTPLSRCRQQLVCFTPSLRIEDAENGADDDWLSFAGP